MSFFPTPKKTAMKNENIRALFLLLLLTMLILAVSAACRPKEKLVRETVTVQDTSAVTQLQSTVDSLQSRTYRLQTEKTILQTQLASTVTGTQDRDSALPAPEAFRVASGPHYFTAMVQGRLLDYTLHIAAQESRTTTKTDSTARYRRQITALRDSLSHYQASAQRSTREEITVEQPGFFQRALTVLKNAWWLLLLGAILYILLRRVSPIPLP